MIIVGRSVGVRVSRKSLDWRERIVALGVAAVLRAAWVGKLVLVELHVDAGAAEGHPLHTKVESLLSGVFAGNSDGATRTDYTMPG